jgi:hypothetical protein
MHLNGQDAMPWTRKLLIFKCIPGSQTGHRGFDGEVRIGTLGALLYFGILGAHGRTAVEACG